MSGVSIFEYSCYKSFARDLIKTFPNDGRGALKKIASHTRMHPSLVSQILNGDKHLTLEHGESLSRFFALSHLETDYLLHLIQRARAGTHDLERFFDAKLADLRERSRRVSEHVDAEAVLSDRNQAQYYSDWSYSAVRLAIDIRGLQSRPAIAQALSLPLTTVDKVVQFLIATGLCQENDGLLSNQVSRTHLPQESPFILNHHRNWRHRTIELLSELQERDLCFTAPFTCADEDIPRIRAILLKAIREVSGLVKSSEGQRLCFLNVDLIGLQKKVTPSS